MISSVVGFDLGYSSCYIAIARGGGIEIVDNEYSKRDSPTCVSYGGTSEPGRKMGISAYSQRSMNVKSTVTGFKPLIGRKFSDPVSTSYISEMFNNVVKQQDESIGFQVDYEEGSLVLSPENITSSLLVYLKETAEAKLGFTVTDCVISVPLYFNDYQRRALLFAATTVGLNVLRMLNDTTAIALAYGIYKQDLPAEQEKPRLVVFVDVGDNDTQVSAVAFNKGKLEVRKSVSDSCLGGRYFTKRIFNHFKTEFQAKFKIDASSRAKSTYRLLGECDKMKKTMSANSTAIPLNIECFMNDIDVTGRLSREEFEALSIDLFDRFSQLLQELLHGAPFTVNDIDAVEVVGGSCRIPRVKSVIADILHKPCSTTLNADEAVARGCALQCAILSPAFKVRDFTIHDIVPYGIKLVWYDVNGNLGGDMEVFAKSHQFPFSKMLTFYRKEDLILEASYSTPVPHPQNFIGRFKIGPIKPNEDGSSIKVKVKVKVDIHGVMLIESAHTVTKVQVPVEDNKEKKEEAEKMDTEEDKTTDAAETSPSEKAEKIEKKDPEEKSEDKMNVDEAQVNGDNIIKTVEDEKKKFKTKSVQNPLNVSHERPGYSDENLLEATERENQMISNDKLIRMRLKAKNAVEEYVYDMRGQLYDKYNDYVSDSDKTKFSTFLEDVESWLYCDGENCQKQVYVDKLDELKKIGDPIIRRYTEHQGRQGALNILGSSLVHFRKVIDLIASKDERYEHLSEEEVLTLSTKVTEVTEYFDDVCNKHTAQKLYEDPLVLVAQINNKRKELEDKCAPIVNKPKPKVEPPPQTEANKNEENTNSKSADNDATPPSTEQSTPPTEESNENPTSMDLD